MFFKYRLHLRVRSSSQKDFFNISDILSKFKKTINEGVDGFNVRIHGPVFLPESRKLVTLHRAAHGDNKSREQRAIHITKNLWVLEVSFGAKNVSDSRKFFNQFWLDTLESIKESPVSFDWSITKLLFCPLSLMVRTPPFRGGNTSSNLVEDR